MTTWPQSRSASAIVALTALLVGTAALCTEVYEAHRNTLANNPHWTCPKVSPRSLSRTPLAIAYYSSRAALSRNRLDLSPFFGYQEVLYQPTLRLREMDGRFSLDADAHLSVIFDRDERGYSGVLFSRHPRIESVYFEATPDGQFVRRVPIMAVGAGWHRFRLVLDGEKAHLFLDGAPLVTEGRRAAAGQFGFRGGMAPALVDDLEIDSDEGHFSESFRNTSGFAAVFASALGALLALLLVTLLAIRRRTWPVAVAMGLGICLFIDVCAASFGLIDHYILSARYPLPKRPAQSTRLQWEEQLRSRLRRDYPSTDRSQVRILVMGSSQARGDGAREPDGKTFSRIQARFSQELPAFGVRCINVAMPGFSLSRLLELYQTEWLALGPRIVVVYPRNWDLEPTMFRQSLEALARLNEQSGIATLFVLEAQAPDASANRGPQEQATREVATHFGIEVLDLEDYLLPRQNQGFLYSDAGHLSSFGQQMAADFLFPVLLKLVNQLHSQH